MIVYLARDIPAFVMYCVNGESGSSLLIESTDSDTSELSGACIYTLTLAYCTVDIRIWCTKLSVALYTGIYVCGILIAQ